MLAVPCSINSFYIYSLYRSCLIVHIASDYLRLMPNLPFYFSARHYSSKYFGTIGF